MFTLNNIYEETRIQTIKQAYEAKLFLEKFSKDSEYQKNFNTLFNYLTIVERELDYFRREIENDLQINTTAK